MSARLFLFILVTIFITGLGNLLLLRFESGDVYPPYSSLRADPLGTKMFFESLENIKEVSVHRNYGPVSRLAWNSPETLFFIGVQDMALDSVPEKEINALESIVYAGGRLVFLFYPQKPCKCDDDKKMTDLGQSPDDKVEKTPVSKDEETDFSGESSLKERWGFETGRTMMKSENEQKNSAASLVEKNGLLPGEIDFHSALYFTNIRENWKTVYSRGDVPVMMERSLGKGSIVIAGDAFLVSNEALAEKRNSALLSWFIGPNRSITIDETHLGIMKTQGVVSLARKYGLESLFGAIMLVTLLFIWRNSVSLVPPVDEEDFPGRLGAGKQKRDHLSGFSGLLKRKVPSNRILALCLEEWEKSQGINSSHTPEETREIGAIIKKVKGDEKNNIDQIALYNRISKLLWKRRYGA